LDTKNFSIAFAKLFSILLKTLAGPKTAKVTRPGGYRQSTCQGAAVLVVVLGTRIFGGFLK